MKLRDKVQAVLDSDLSSYALNKEYGINASKIGRLRSGKNSIDDISLAFAEKLEEVYDKALD
ncbi:XRE family transcriptional regulator [Weissella ceti]|uniref:XRE family transcriptional regulator n=1 Tax=Weissella ceti TaxID=759620 RepID=UPI001BCF3DA9|nr:XRE family transcriptional regulator [Weissella ceti]QVK12803.1 XRE family transcriptional regulator [Weissella ceti]